MCDDFMLVCSDGRCSLSNAVFVRLHACVLMNYRQIQGYNNMCSVQFENLNLLLYPLVNHCNLLYPASIIIFVLLRSVHMQNREQYKNNTGLFFQSDTAESD
eukprot:303524_1